MAPVNFLNRVISYYQKIPKKDVPSIKPWTAVALSVLYTLIYVLPFYLSAKTRPSPKLSRDAPSVIRARIRAVTFSCVVTAIITIYIATQIGQLAPRDTIQLLGWWPLNPLDLLRTFGLLILLFLGPLFEAGIVEGKWRDWIRSRNIAETLGSSLGWRNYVAGPITEELVFRSFVIHLHLLAKMSPSKIVFITPLYFGIAHIHHFYEYTLTHPHTPLLPAMARSLFQFAYTSFFGFYAAFVFLRTANLPAVILAHSFCNYMGLPRLWGRVEAPVAMGPPDFAKKEDPKSPLQTTAARMQVAQGRLNFAWTLAYYLLLVLGAVGFSYYLWDLTDSANALVSFGKLV